MFDFRYHALSLVAVFLALAVGLLLGVAIGDSGLVSSARQDLIGQLRRDVGSAREDASRAREDLARHEDYENQTYPDVVAGQLSGSRVALLFLGDASDEVVDDVRRSIEPAGAELAYVGVVREPPDLEAIAARAGDTRYAALSDDASLLAPFAERVGRQLMLGGKLVSDVRPALMRSFSGELAPLNGVVVYRSPTPPDDDEQARLRTESLENGLMRGLAETDLPVVGVELLEQDPSQVGWYRARNMASVDSVDQVWGRAALVFALAGAEGAYGVKPSAEAMLPRVVNGVARP